MDVELAGLRRISLIDETWEAITTLFGHLSLTSVRTLELQAYTRDTRQHPFFLQRLGVALNLSANPISYLQATANGNGGAITFQIKTETISVSLLCTSALAGMHLLRDTLDKLPLRNLDTLDIGGYVEGIQPHPDFFTLFQNLQFLRVIAIRDCFIESFGLFLTEQVNMLKKRMMHLIAHVAFPALETIILEDLAEVSEERTARFEVLGAYLRGRKENEMRIAELVVIHSYPLDIDWVVEFESLTSFMEITKEVPDA